MFWRRGFAEAFKAVRIRLLIDSGTHDALSANPAASLKAGLPSKTNPVVDSATVLHKHALASDTATLVATDVAGDSKIIIICPYTRIDLAENTTGSVEDLCSLILTNVSAGHPVSSVATPGMANSKKKAFSGDKSPRTRKKLSPVFDNVKLKLPPSAGAVKKAPSSRSKLHSVPVFSRAQYARRAVPSSADACDADG